MVEFLFDNLGELPTLSENSSIVDLGTGNGHLLFQIKEEGFKGMLTGVDYSEVSVLFANEIAREQEFTDIEFIQSDVLDANDNFLQKVKGTCDIILDKGTFDAILLNDSKNQDGKTGVEIYPENVKQMLKKDGILLITSCNFSKDELIKLISADDLKVWKQIDYPSFEFGGVTGSTICSILFIKL